MPLGRIPCGSGLPLATSALEISGRVSIEEHAESAVAASIAITRHAAAPLLILIMASFPFRPTTTSFAPGGRQADEARHRLRVAVKNVTTPPQGCQTDGRDLLSGLRRAYTEVSSLPGVSSYPARQAEPGLGGNIPSRLHCCAFGAVQAESTEIHGASRAAAIQKVI